MDISSFSALLHRLPIHFLLFLTRYDFIAHFLKTLQNFILPLKLYVSLTISITVCTLVYYFNSKLISCVLLLIFLVSVIYFYKGIILSVFQKIKNNTKKIFNDHLI